MRVLLVTALLASGCGRAHEGGEGRGHEHGEGGDEPPGQSVTGWTDTHELFMEYDPLVVGQESAFAAHVTWLADHSPASEGRVVVAIHMKDGAALEARADAPESPGVFRPTVTPGAAGPCAMTVTIESHGVRDTISLPRCQVFADLAAARKAVGEEKEPAGRITYLKEQAWKTEFATLRVAERDLQPAVRATAEIVPAPGKEARLTAPVGGRVTLAEPVPVLGSQVAKGQLLATVLPGMPGADPAGLAADVAAARAELEAAEAQLARAERLLAERAIPEKQVEEARTRVAVARARAQGARGRSAQLAAGTSGAGRARGAFRVVSPIAGTLVAASATTGQTVAEGDPLFSVIDLSSLWLQAKVFEPDIAKVEGTRGAWFEVEGYDEPFRVEPPGGRLVTIGRVVDPRSRTVPIVFELVNPDGRLRVGQFAVAWIATGQPVRALAVPESAVVDDAGKPVAYVQVEGEAFERRPLALGVRSAGWVEVTAGLAAGEHVVSKGAYEIKLASSAGAVPAHGHAH
ncbi:MAG TPA: efflux RND transporter periplasmic adaptor subunit [Kofleriaceae bacterium]|nr:efflux RND transporter periplasmic adaptor subunit [Kofleriaceae bacterium]